jgi:hypothetical protein
MEYEHAGGAAMTSDEIQSEEAALPGRQALLRVPGL